MERRADEHHLGVFGLLAGREFAIGMDTWLRTNRKTAMIVVKDAFKAAIGLGISIAMALGLR